MTKRDPTVIRTQWQSKTTALQKQSTPQYTSMILDNVARTPHPSRDRQAIDFMLVLDDSGSINDEVDEMEDFAKEVVDGFTLSEAEGKFGVVTFHSEAKTRTSLTTDRDKIFRAIDKLTGGGATSISDGLTKAQDEYDAHARADAERIVLLLSDGEQTVDCVTDEHCSQTAILASLPLKAAGATIFAWGFGDITEETLQGIASDPSKARCGPLRPLRP